MLFYEMLVMPLNLVFFFFQAEDGIRDGTVTGVQTCALPISRGNLDDHFARLGDDRLATETRVQLQIGRHVETVGLIIVHVGEIFGAFFHPYVAGRARAVSAAGMIETDAVV